MRMNWFDWLASQVRPSPRRKPERKRGKGTKISKWRVGVPASLCLARMPKRKFEYFAFTKSEARAMLKREMGWSRVPVGVAFTKV